MKTLSERVKYRMDVLGLKGAQLAKKLGISRVSVFNWINGRTLSIRGDLLIKAAKELECDPTWLSTGQMGTGVTLVAEKQGQYSDAKSVQVVVQDLHGWPFVRITPAQYNSLHREQKRAIEQIIVGFLAGSVDTKQFEPAKDAAV